MRLSYRIGVLPEYDILELYSPVMIVVPGGQHRTLSPPKPNFLPARTLDLPLLV